MGRVVGVYLVQHAVRGRLYWVLRWRDSFNKLHSKSLGPKAGLSKRAAERARREWEQSLAAKVVPSAPSGPYDTLGAYRAFYLSVRRPELAEHSFAGVERATGLLAAFLGPQILLCEIKPIQIRAFSAAMANGELPDVAAFGRGTVRRYMAVSKTMLAHAVVDGLVEKSPFVGIRLPGESKALWRYVRIDQFEAVMEQAPVHWKPFLACCRLAGLRRSEAARLRWQDVDFAEPGRIRVGRAKTAAGRRDVPMCPALRSILMQTFESAREGTAEVIGLHNERFGDGRVLDHAIEAAGVPRFHLHWLRKSWCTDMARAGTPPAALQRWAGHASYAVTMRYYQGVLDVDFEKAAGMTPGEDLRGRRGARISDVCSNRDEKSGAD